MKNTSIQNARTYATNLGLDRWHGEGLAQHLWMSGPHGEDFESGQLAEMTATWMAANTEDGMAKKNPAEVCPKCGVEVYKNDDYQCWSCKTAAKKSKFKRKKDLWLRERAPGLRRNPAERARAVNGRIWDIEVEGKPVAQVLASDAPAARSQVDVRPGKLRVNPREYGVGVAVGTHVELSPGYDLQPVSANPLGKSKRKKPEQCPPCTVCGSEVYRLECKGCGDTKRFSEAVGGKFPKTCDACGKRVEIQCEGCPTKWGSFGAVNPLGPGKRLLAKGATKKRYDVYIPDPGGVGVLKKDPLKGFRARFYRRFNVVCPDGKFAVANDPHYGDHVFSVDELWDAYQTCKDSVWADEVLTVLGL